MTDVVAIVTPRARTTSAVREPQAPLAPVEPLAPQAPSERVCRAAILIG